MDAENEKRKSFLGYYLMAAVGGVITFVIILLAFKGIVLAGKFLLNYWLWIIAIIIALLFLKKLLSRKVMVMKK